MNIYDFWGLAVENPEGRSFRYATVALGFRGKIYQNILVPSSARSHGLVGPYFTPFIGRPSAVVADVFPSSIALLPHNTSATYTVTHLISITLERLTAHLVLRVTARWILALHLN